MFFLFNSFGYADSTRRTDKATEVTAHTLGAYQTWTAGLFDSRRFVAYP